MTTEIKALAREIKAVSSLNEKGAHSLASHMLVTEEATNAIIDAMLSVLVAQGVIDFEESEQLWDIYAAI